MKISYVHFVFRTCGLFPLGRDTAENDKVVIMPGIHLDGVLENNDVRSLSRRRCLNALSVIEERIPADDLEAFKATFDQHKEWDGAVRCQELFEVWSKLKVEAKTLSDEV